VLTKFGDRERSFSRTKISRLGLELPWPQLLPLAASALAWQTTSYLANLSKSTKTLLQHD